MRKLITYFIFMTFFISLVIFQTGEVTAKDHFGSGKWKNYSCNLAGTWRILNDDQETTGIGTFIPLDLMGRSFSVLVDAPLPEDPTFFGTWYSEEDPEVTGTAISPTRGIAIKVAKNLYRFTLSKRILNFNGDQIGEVEMSGETKFEDCDNRLIRYRVKLFDADGIQFNCWSPPVREATRYEVDEPCGELPSWQE